MGNESQKHGLLFEEQVIAHLNLIPYGYTHEFDAKCGKGINYSIKFIAMFGAINMGSAVSQFRKEDGYQFILGRYRQEKTKKIVHSAHKYEISLEQHQQWFPASLLDQILELEDTIKRVPEGFVRPQTRQNILWQVQKIKMPFGVTLNPKMDSHKQRRLQCSLQNMSAWELSLPNVALDFLIGQEYRSAVRRRNPKSNADLSKEFEK